MDRMAVMLATVFINWSTSIAWWYWFYGQTSIVVDDFYVPRAVCINTQPKQLE